MIHLSTPYRWGMILAASVSLATPGYAQDDTLPPPLAPLAEPVAAIDANPDHPAYSDLIDAIAEAVDPDAAITAMSATIAREYAEVPQIAALDQAKPGLIDAVVQAMIPVLKAYTARVQEDYRPQMRALFASRLTPAEAVDIATFYRSPTGRKAMSGVSANMSMDNTLADISDEIAAGKDPATIKVKDAQVEKDLFGATQSAMKGLSQDDLIAMGRMAREKPALLKLNGMIGDLVALRTRMENEQPNAEENAAIEAAVIAAVTQHLGQ
jgi:hypothetical protein